MSYSLFITYDEIVTLQAYPPQKQYPLLLADFLRQKHAFFALHSDSFSRAISCFSLSASAELEAPLRTLDSATDALLESASTASCATDVAFSVNGASLSFCLRSGFMFVSVFGFVFVAVAIINP
ncbi:hypothetical protein A2I98_07860 [Pseudoalteromonas agarivorans]|uniref:Uncharacterized protein n=1 Tax=Pseudoalteromonas agarivorans TaxID=176102 RepID=A0ABR5VV86_9GAMM|nr:hypothetical protein A2I98_07860 [Pseudoalteromonas telluritireducens]